MADGYDCAMSASSGAAVAALAKRNRIVRAFSHAKALGPESARTLQELGLTSGLVVQRMIHGGVLRECQGGRLWLDEQANAAFRRRARWRIAAVIAVGAVVIVIGLLR